MKSAVFLMRSEVWIFFGVGGRITICWFFLFVLFFFFSHKDLVDFQPNKIVDTMNYMCLANWQT